MRSRTERRRRETQSRRGRNPRKPPAEAGRPPAATIFSCRSNGPKAGIVTTGGSAAERWVTRGFRVGKLERNGRQRRPTNQQTSPANEPERSERRVGAQRAPAAPDKSTDVSRDRA